MIHARLALLIVLWFALACCWTAPSVAVPLPAPDYRSVSAELAQALLTSQRPSGALPYTLDRIEPYFANRAAMGLLHVVAPSQPQVLLTAVQRWMAWYVGHIDASGTIDDYSIDATTGAEVALGSRDSEDSYAATFLSLALKAYQRGNANLQAYIKSIQPQLRLISQAVLALQQEDGLTWAKSDYHVKLLMDNSEVYAGLRDAALLFDLINGPSHLIEWSGRLLTGALRCAAGVESLWQSVGGIYAIRKYEDGHVDVPAWTTPLSSTPTSWYPDATAQLFPALYNVPMPAGRAAVIWNHFNNAWPGWPQLSFQSSDPFPWALVGFSATRRCDWARFDQYFASINPIYLSKQLPWPWYNAESGWMLQALARAAERAPCTP
jgi:hypothetical protein